VAEPILVTGSASGIGAATVARLREAGREVIGVDLRGGDERCDLADPAQVQALAVRLPARLGGIAHVAGLPGTRPSADVLRVNLLAPRRLSELLAERILSGGAIVYVASVAAARSPLEVEPLLELPDEGLLQWLARGGLDGSATYDFTKKALVALALAHARELLGRGVRVLSVSPGPTETPILADFEASMGVDRMRAAVSLVGRHGSAMEIANVVEFLLGERASWVNAIDVRVDGGLIGIR
jgi:NAD(P)-dependent dehydrogenase (short-subunit alcohol dehydrogenase family)